MIKVASSFLFGLITPARQNFGIFLNHPKALLNPVSKNQNSIYSRVSPKNCRCSKSVKVENVTQTTKKIELNGRQ